MWHNGDDPLVPKHKTLVPQEAGFVCAGGERTAAVSSCAALLLVGEPSQHALGASQLVEQLFNSRSQPSSLHSVSQLLPHVAQPVRCRTQPQGWPTMCDKASPVFESIIGITCTTSSASVSATAARSMLARWRLFTGATGVAGAA